MYKENNSGRTLRQLQSPAAVISGSSIGQEERNRLSSRLHDGLGQELVCLKMAAHRLSGQLDKSGTEESRSQVQDLMMMIEGILGSVRKIAQEIRPRVLQEFGLIDAVCSEISDLKKRTGVTLLVTRETSVFKAGAHVELEVLRVVQELLRMLVEKSPAGDINVLFSRNESQGIIEIRQSNPGNQKRLEDIQTALLLMKLRIQGVGGEMTNMIRNRKLIISLNIPLIINN